MGECAHLLLFLCPNIRGDPLPSLPTFTDFCSDSLTAAAAGRGGEEGGRLPHGFEHGLPEV